MDHLVLGVRQGLQVNIAPDSREHLRTVLRVPDTQQEQWWPRKGGTAIRGISKRYQESDT